MTDSRLAGQNVDVAVSPTPDNRLAGQNVDVAITTTPDSRLAGQNVDVALGISYYHTAVMSAIPKMYLAMQELSGTTATDVTGLALAGTYVSGVTINDTTDPASFVSLGQHVRLDGTNGHVKLATGSWLDPTAGFSFEGWFYVRAWTTSARIFDFANAANTDDMLLKHNGTDLSLKIAGSTTTFPAWTINTWTHLVITVSSAGATNVYLNGSPYSTGTVGSPTSGTRNNMYLGKSAWSDPYLSASMMHVSLIHRVLTALEVMTHYLAGIGALFPMAIPSTGAVGAPTITVTGGTQTYVEMILTDSPWGYWKLESGGTDSSGNSHTATPGSGVTFETGKVGNAARFHGGSEVIDIAAGNVLGPQNNISWEFWFKVASAADRKGLLTCDNESSGRNWSFRTASGGGIDCLVFSPGVTTFVTSGNYADNNWHHFVATWTNGGTLYAYVDKVQVGSAGASGTVEGNAASAMKIGYASAFGAVTGYIDEVAIYTSVLSPTRITAHYNKGMGIEPQTLSPGGIASGTAFGTAVISGGATGSHFEMWTGTAWVSKPLQMWTGTAWESKPMSRWTGTAWELVP